MKWTTLATAFAAVPLASAAMFTKEQYRSGEVMSSMMEAKEVRFTPLLTSLACINASSVCLG